VYTERRVDPESYKFLYSFNLIESKILDVVLQLDSFRIERKIILNLSTVP